MVEKREALSSFVWIINAFPAAHWTVFVVCEEEEEESQSWVRKRAQNTLELHPSLPTRQAISWGGVWGCGSYDFLSFSYMLAGLKVCHTG